MDKNRIEQFLAKRDARVTTIEIANKLYQTAGTENLKSKIHHPSLDNFESGCVMNYFAFTQKTLVDFIFMNFITVIGSYHTKSDSLKAWTKIPFTNEDEKNTAMSQLKEIRARYADTRNNFICHINDDMHNCSSSVLTQQINDDVMILRNIFNIIRRANNLAIVITTYSPSDHYSVLGLDKLISIASDGLSVAQPRPETLLE